MLRDFTVDTFQATFSQAEPILVSKYASVLQSGGLLQCRYQGCNLLFSGLVRMLSLFASLGHMLIEQVFGVLVQIAGFQSSDRFINLLFDSYICLLVFGPQFRRVRLAQHAVRSSDHAYPYRACFG